jgi:hypothetical protein
MASYRGHLALAAPLGVVYGSLTLLEPKPDWGPGVLAAGFTTLGGLMPDLDSDSGVPVRELFGIMSAVVAGLAYHPLRKLGWPLEQAFVGVAFTYFFVRYVVASVFRRFTAHRGMFHSIPALVIAGLATYLSYPSSDAGMRLYFAGGVMVGFLSHLVLDEIYAIDFNGLRFKQNQFAGTAFKFTSPSWSATATTYLIAGSLAYVAWNGGLTHVHWPGQLQKPSWLHLPQALRTH